MRQKDTWLLQSNKLLYVDQTMSEDLKAQLISLEFKPAHAEAYISARGRCEYCGADLIRNRLAYAGLQIDHIRPSGGEEASNLALSCAICNSVKSNWLPDEEAQLDRAELMLAIRRYIKDKAEKHDKLWIEVNKVLRDKWWEADA